MATSYSQMDPELRNAFDEELISALLEGSGMNQIAKDYGIPVGSISGIAQRKHIADEVIRRRLGSKKSPAPSGSPKTSPAPSSRSPYIDDETQAVIEKALIDTLYNKGSMTTLSNKLGVPRTTLRNLASKEHIRKAVMRRKIHGPELQSPPKKVAMDADDAVERPAQRLPAISALIRGESARESTEDDESDFEFTNVHDILASMEGSIKALRRLFGS